MRLRYFILTAFFALTAPTAAYAGEDDGCESTCGGAAFSPAFSDSPVTLVICTVPESCRIGNPK